MPMSKLREEFLECLNYSISLVSPNSLAEDLKTIKMRAASDLRAIKAQVARDLKAIKAQAASDEEFSKLDLNEITQSVSSLSQKGINLDKLICFLGENEGEKKQQLIEEQRNLHPIWEKQEAKRTTLNQLIDETVNTLRNDKQLTAIFDIDVLCQDIRKRLIANSGRFLTDAEIEPQQLERELVQLADTYILPDINDTILLVGEELRSFISDLQEKIIKLAAKERIFKATDHGNNTYEYAALKGKIFTFGNPAEIKLTDIKTKPSNKLTHMVKQYNLVESLQTALLDNSKPPRERINNFAQAFSGSDNQATLRYSRDPRAMNLIRKIFFYLKVWIKGAIKKSRNTLFQQDVSYKLSPEHYAKLVKEREKQSGDYSAKGKMKCN